MKPRRTAAALAMMALVGCTLTQSDLRKGVGLTRIGGGENAGRLITPKRCTLRVVSLSRPAGDKLLDEVVWRDADLQAVSDEARRGWEANGLRIGRIAGELPSEVQALLNAPPPQKVTPAVFVLPNGEKTLLDLGPASAQISLFLAQGDHSAPVGKVYQDARPFLRVTASHDEADGVALRIVPEVHHGPVRQGWGAAPGNGFEAQRFVVKSGQEEDTFRELAATLSLRPGQVAVLGGRVGRAGTLGDFLFTEPEGTSDRPLQKIFLIWAERTDPATLPDNGPTPPPKLEPVDPPDMPVERSAATGRKGIDLGKARG